MYVEDTEVLFHSCYVCPDYICMCSSLACQLCIVRSLTHILYCITVYSNKVTIYATYGAFLNSNLILLMPYCMQSYKYATVLKSRSSEAEVCTFCKKEKKLASNWRLSSQSLAIASNSTYSSCEVFIRIKCSKKALARTWLKCKVKAGA